MSSPVILIAEDDEKSRRLLVDVLTFEGYCVVSATTGDEAIDLARQRQPALALLDIHLPQKDGFEVLRALRASADTATIPAIAVTASVMARDQERIENAGFNGYHAKPIDIESLSRTVKSMLGSTGAE